MGVSVRSGRMKQNQKKTRFTNARVEDLGVFSKWRDKSVARWQKRQECIHMLYHRVIVSFVLHGIVILILILISNPLAPNGCSYFPMARNPRKKTTHTHTHIHTFFFECPFSRTRYKAHLFCPFLSQNTTTFMMRLLCLRTICVCQCVCVCIK